MWFAGAIVARPKRWLVQLHCIKPAGTTALAVLLERAGRTVVLRASMNSQGLGFAPDQACSGGSVSSEHLHYGLGAAANVKLFVDAVEVSSHGLDAAIEPVGDLLAALRHRGIGT